MPPACRVKLHINAPTNASWEIAAQRTSAHLSEGTSSGTSTRQSSEGSSSAVHLGVLLGAGSFGRVYKGEWQAAARLNGCVFTQHCWGGAAATWGG